MPRRSRAKGVFISYSRTDAEIVAIAARLLAAGGATVFRDVVDIDFGDKWRDVLFETIARCERVMVFWSAAAARSKWVRREWRAALQLGKRVVPLLLDKTPLPLQLSQFHGNDDLIDILLVTARKHPRPKLDPRPNGGGALYGGASQSRSSLPLASEAPSRLPARTWVLIAIVVMVAITAATAYFAFEAVRVAVDHHVLFAVTILLLTIVVAHFVRRRRWFPKPREVFIDEDGITLCLVAEPSRKHDYSANYGGVVRSLKIENMGKRFADIVFSESR